MNEQYNEPDEVNLFRYFLELTFRLISHLTLVTKFENRDRVDGREMRRASFPSAACVNSVSSVKATLCGVCKYTPCGSASPC